MSPTEIIVVMGVYLTLAIIIMGLMVSLLRERVATLEKQVFYLQQKAAGIRDQLKDKP